MAATPAQLGLPFQLASPSVERLMSRSCPWPNSALLRGFAGDDGADDVATRTPFSSSCADDDKGGVDPRAEQELRRSGARDADGASAGWQGPGTNTGMLRGVLRSNPHASDPWKLPVR